MKKICFVTTLYTTYKSFLVDFSYYLYNTGEYDISLICNYEDSIYTDLPDFVHYFPVNMKRGIDLFAYKSIKKITKIIKENNFDIVQYSTPNAALYTSIAAKKAKTPVRLYCQWGIRFMGFKGWKKQVFKFLEKITCDNSTFIEAESHNIRKFSIKEKLYNEDKSSVIWNGSACGVNLNKFDITKKKYWRKEIREKYNINDDEIVLAYAARLTVDKGINEFLTAANNLYAKTDKFKMFIMGRKDYNDKITAKNIKNNINNPDFYFLGNVDDIEKYYSASDIFVSPSYREGFGLVVIEAESMGLPAIVSDVPGQTDTIIPNKTGLLCKVKDVKTLQKAMKILIENNDMRNNMSQNAYNFTKDNFDQKMLFKYLKQHRTELINNKII